MKLIKTALLALSIPSGAVIHTQTNASRAKVGDVFEIRNEYTTSQSSGDESSGSSSGHTTMIERVIDVRTDGVVLEYDLPQETKPIDRSRQWQFPARILRPVVGPISLLNSAALEARATDWLKRAKLARADCGRWIFTWNAFRIECDPESAIKIVKQYDLGNERLVAGVRYDDVQATQSGFLDKGIVTAEGTQFAVSLPLDADKVRREMAESDMIVAEIMRKPITLDQALGAQKKKDIAGSLSITLDVLPSGQLWCRASVTKVRIAEASQKIETRMVTETIERRKIDEQDRKTRIDER